LATAHQCIETYKPYTLAGFERGIFCSGGGRDANCVTPPGAESANFFVIVTLTPLKMDLSDEHGRHRVSTHWELEFHCGACPPPPSRPVHFTFLAAAVRHLEQVFWGPFSETCFSLLFLNFLFIS
jgi:hypothetical protein